MSAIDGVRQRVRDATERVDVKYREALETTESAELVRHSLGSRLAHWAQVTLFVVLLVTGLMIWTGWYGPLVDQVWGGYYKAFGLHIWAGVLMLAVTFVLFPFYHVVVDGHDPRVSLDDLREAASIGAAFAGLRRYIRGYHHARRTVDRAEGDWVAHHPMQKVFWWSHLALFAVLATTGFAMYDRLAADAPAWVGVLGAPVAWLAWETLKQIHLFVALAFSAMVIPHVYFAVVGSNHDVLKSMFVGRLDGYVVGDESDGTDRNGRDAEGDDATDSEDAATTGGTDD